MKNIDRNLTMLCDYYELTMSNGYFVNGMKDKIVYFDVFYRDNPDNGGYAIVAGLEQIIEYVKDLILHSVNEISVAHSKLIIIAKHGKISIYILHKYTSDGNFRSYYLT